MNLSFLTVRARSVWLWGSASAILLWFILINQLRLQWAANAQYSYGWVMPILCVGLVSRRWFDGRPREQSAAFQSDPCAEFSTCRLRATAFEQCLPWFFAFCALLLFPLRLFLEANPDWRTLDWLLACDVVALTLLAIYCSRGPGFTRRLAFPICFILLAVPWPFIAEVPLIQSLTRATVAATVECLGWFGIPASQHGNVIEISTGLVGVADACSGIRSFQSSLMISVFLGEFFRFSLGRRLGLVLAGVSLAFLFNICRTSLMVAVASKQGVAAIERWHDPAGLSISLACVLGLWGLSLLFKRWQSKTQGTQPDASRHWRRSVGFIRQQETLRHGLPDKSGVPIRQCSKLEGPGRVHPAQLGEGPTASGWEASSDPYPLRPWFGHFTLALLVWLVLVEVSVEAWYRTHESGAGPAEDWALNWPTQEPGFHEVPVSEVAREMLCYSEGHSGAWTSEHGVEWSMNYFRWAPGRTAAFAARSHTPGVCLAAAGKTLRSIPDNQCPIMVHSLEFPFRRYEFEENGQQVYVFHCLWEENAPGVYSTTGAAGMLRLRLEAVLEGRRNLGQRSLELVITGVPDLATARNAVQQRLQKLITLVRAP